MSRRRVVLLAVLAVVLVAGIAGTFTVRHLEADHVDRRGSVFVAEAGREFSLPWREPTTYVGTGGGGLLGLVAGKCLGFVHDPRIEEHFREEGRTPPQQPEYVVLWAGSEEVVGEGEDVRVEWEGKTYRLGDRVEGGVTGTFRSELNDELPEECREKKLLRFSVGG